MNLDESVQKHSEWKVKFRAAIASQDQLDAASIGRDNCCDLGKWLYGEGKSALLGRPEFQRAVDSHRDFHLEAGKVANLINAAAYADAERAIANDTRYSEASQRVAIALMALKKAAKL